MRPYEVMIIFEASLEEEEIRAGTDRVAQLIAAKGGAVLRVDPWGKRRLAYELRHRTEGSYVLIEFSAEPQVVVELDRMLRLADEVIRHKVVRIPESVVGRLPVQGPPPPASGEPVGVAGPEA